METEWSPGDTALNELGEWVRVITVLVSYVDSGRRTDFECVNSPSAVRSIERRLFTRRHFVAYCTAEADRLETEVRAHEVLLSAADKVVLTKVTFQHPYYRAIDQIYEEIDFFDAMLSNLPLFPPSYLDAPFQVRVEVSGVDDGKLWYHTSVQHPDTTSLVIKLDTALPDQVYRVVVKRPGSMPDSVNLLNLSGNRLLQIDLGM